MRETPFTYAWQSYFTDCQNNDRLKSLSFAPSHNTTCNSRWRSKLASRNSSQPIYCARADARPWLHRIHKRYSLDNVLALLSPVHHPHLRFRRVVISTGAADILRMLSGAHSLSVHFLCSNNGRTLRRQKNAKVASVFFAGSIELDRTPKNSLTMFSPRRHFCKSGDKELLLLFAAYLEAKVRCNSIHFLQGYSPNRRYCIALLGDLGS